MPGTEGVIQALRAELERTLGCIKGEGYGAQMRAVYRQPAPAELVKDYPAAFFTVAHVITNEAKSAGSRIERIVTFKVVVVTREAIKRTVEEATDTAVRDVERALSKELATARANVKERSGADLVFWGPPNWERIDTTMVTPYGTAHGTIRATVRYDYGRP